MSEFCAELQDLKEYNLYKDVSNNCFSRFLECIELNPYAEDDALLR